MTVGINLDLGIIFENTLLVLGLLIGLIVLKTLITMVLCRISGISNAVSLNTALVLGQAGEFGFVLFALAGGFGLLEAREATILSAVIALI
jgi:Kef-type K+ transport system membrane component KefB